MAAAPDAADSIFIPGTALTSVWFCCVTQGFTLAVSVRLRAGAWADPVLWVRRGDAPLPQFDSY